MPTTITNSTAATLTNTMTALKPGALADADDEDDSDEGDESQSPRCLNVMRDAAEL